MMGCRCSSFDNITLVSGREQNSTFEIAVAVRNDPLRFHLDSLDSGRNCFTQSNCTLILDRIHEQWDHVLQNIDIWESVWKKILRLMIPVHRYHHIEKNDKISTSVTDATVEVNFLRTSVRTNYVWGDWTLTNSWTEKVMRTPMFLSSLLKYCFAVHKHERSRNQSLYLKTLSMLHHQSFKLCSKTDASRNKAYSENFCKTVFQSDALLFLKMFLMINSVTS